MDIYQCMTCGERWAHGGSLAGFVAQAAHVEYHWREKKPVREREYHVVLVGEIEQLARFYRRYQAGGALTLPGQGASAWAGHRTIRVKRKAARARPKPITTPGPVDRNIVYDVEDVVPGGAMSKW